PTAAGFGLLPGFLIDAGTDRDRCPTAVAANPACPGLRIEDDTAVVIRGRHIQVVGSATVTAYPAPGAGQEALAGARTAGGSFDLFQLRRAAANRAATDAFPPARPKDPVVASGSLEIVGGGGASPEIWQKFIALAGGPDAPLVMLPTALDDPVPVQP